MSYEGTALTINSLDQINRTGITSDLKTFSSFYVDGVSIASSIISKNSNRQKNIHEIPKKVLEDQLNSVLDEYIFNSVKIGFFPGKDHLDEILKIVKKYDLNKIVLDLSLVDNKVLTYDEIKNSLLEDFLPEVFILVLDIEKAEKVSDINIENKDDAQKAADIIEKKGPDFVLIKNRSIKDFADLLYDGDSYNYHEGYETDEDNHLEARSTFSAAVTSCLAKGLDMDKTIGISEDYVKRAVISSTEVKDKKHLDHSIKPLDLSAFEEEAEDFDSWFENNKNVFESEFKAEKELMVNPENAVSIGVGSGLFASRLGIKYGVEPATGMAELSKEKGINAMKGVAEYVPLPDEQFDTVLMSTILSYVDDPQKAVDEAYRILKSGGNLVVSFLPKEGSYTMLYDLARLLGKHDPERSPEHPYPIKFIKGSDWVSIDQVKKLMKNAGFVDFKYVQTLTKHPKFTNEEIEEPVAGYKEGDYVVIRGEKP